MKTRVVKIEAGGTVRDSGAGGYLGVQSVTGNRSFDITWLDGAGQSRGSVVGVKAGQKFLLPFNGFVLAGTVNDVVTLLVGEPGEDADPAMAGPSVVVANTPLPVTLPAGAQSVQEQLATVLTAVAPVAVTAAGVVALAVDATRRVVYWRNAGAESIALIKAGQAFADAAIVLQPGEAWVEDKAPGAAWNAICAAALASTLNILTGA